MPSAPAPASPSTGSSPRCEPPGRAPRPRPARRPPGPSGSVRPSATPPDSVADDVKATAGDVGSRRPEGRRRHQGRRREDRPNGSRRGPQDDLDHAVPVPAAPPGRPRARPRRRRARADRPTAGRNPPPPGGRRFAAAWRRLSRWRVMVDARSWGERDAAVVWHGFTQMASYLDNEPVIVERGRGPRADRRRGAPLPRRHLVAVGHHARPPGARARRRPPRPDRPRRPLDPARQRQPRRGRAGRGAGPGRARRRPALPVRLRRGGRGRAGAEDRVPVLGQPGRRAAAPATSPSGTPTTATPSARCRSAPAASAPTCSTRCGSARSPRAAAPSCGPRLRRSRRARRRRPPGRRARPSAGGRGHRAAGAGRRRHAGRRPERPTGRWSTACRRHDVLLICDEVATGFGRTGTLFASEQCGLRPDLMRIGKGLTGGYLPMSATVASRPRLRAPSSAPTCRRETLYHGHSYSGNALAAAVALRAPRALDEWDVLGRRPRPGRDAGSAGRRAVGAARPQVADVRLCGLMAGVELAPPADGLRWGRRVCAAAVRRGVLLRPLGDVVVLMPPLTVTDAEIERIVDTLGRRHRRGGGRGTHGRAQRGPRRSGPARRRGNRSPGLPGSVTGPVTPDLGRAGRRRARRHPGRRALAGHPRRWSRRGP